jgi:hypothetical protein
MYLDLVGPEVEELEVELYVFICTCILLAPRLRNFRLRRVPRAATGMEVKKLLDRSSSTRFTKPTEKKSKD